MDTLFVTIKDSIATIKDFVLGVSPWIPGERKYGAGSLSPQELRDAIAREVPGAEINHLRQRH